MRSGCTKAAQGRRIKRYPEDETRDALRVVMQHRQARRIFSQRKAIVEPVFSSLRCQQGLNRFRRSGLRAVKREFALHVLAHNLSRAVALLGALFAFLYVVLSALSEAPRRFCEKFHPLAPVTPSNLPAHGLYKVASPERFATASEGRGLPRNRSNPPSFKPTVIPAKAGINKPLEKAISLWFPAFAGMTGYVFRIRFSSNLGIHADTHAITLR